MMNFPTDPKERTRITTAVLQYKFRNELNRQQNYSIIDENDDEQIYHADQTDQQQVSATNGPKQYGSCIPKDDDRCQLDKQQTSNLIAHQQYTSSRRGRQNGQRYTDFMIEHYGKGQSRHLQPRSRVHDAPSRIAHVCVKNSGSNLLNIIKRRLSLPADTPVTSNLLDRPRQESIDFDEESSLSRVDRRRSLSHIGFGKLATYSKLHVLGSGTYSIVYKGTSRLTEKFVALKEIHLERDEGVPFTAIREVSLLKQLRHNNIITLHDIIYANLTIIMVFEFVDRDLSRYMEECDHKINMDNVRLYLFQLIRALKYCHDRKVLHRDIKPQNILISKTGDLKLADFGLARAKSFPTKTYTDEVVTLWYRPPDILLGNVDYGTSIDMWGVGCIFFEMAAGHTLFSGLDSKKQISSIFEIIGTPNETEWPTFKSDLKSCSIDIPSYPGRNLAFIAPRLDKDGRDLLKKFLKCNPNLRIPSGEALHHKYFESLPKEIYDLQDTASIFSIQSLRLSEEATLGNSIQHNVRV